MCVSRVTPKLGINNGFNLNNNNLCKEIVGKRIATPAFPSPPRMRACSEKQTMLDWLGKYFRDVLFVVLLYLSAANFKLYRLLGVC